MLEVVVSEWISIASMVGTIGAVAGGWRLQMLRNRDAQESMDKRLEAIERQLANGNFIPREALTERLNGINSRLDRIDQQLVRVEDAARCDWPNCPAGTRGIANGSG